MLKYEAVPVTLSIVYDHGYTTTIVQKYLLNTKNKNNIQSDDI